MFKDINNKGEEEFFKMLAHLFYAVGMADKKFLREEKVAIIDAVEKGGFSEIDTIAFKDIMYQTLKELIEYDVKPAIAFDVFKKYYNENIQLFPKKLRKEIQQAVQKIISADERRNKSEVVFLTKLHLLFKV